MSSFLRQCFVTFGVALNMTQFSFILGYTAVLLPQLRAPGSSIHVDEDAGSWIAAMPGFAIILGNFTTPTIMGLYGRKIAQIFSILVVIIGWVCIAAATTVIPIYVARILHGVSLGISISLGPILIAECTSPINRGAFLSSVSFIMAIGTLIVHTVGSYTTWQITAIVCGLISVINFCIIILSPESPSWLASQGRYEDCRKVFHWLRGYQENDELNKILATCIYKDLAADDNNTVFPGNDLKSKIIHFKHCVFEKDFYKPICAMVHVYVLREWAGINILVPYITYVIDGLIDKEKVDVPLLIVSVDSQKVILTLVAVYLFKKFKRRTMLISTATMCITTLVVTAGYNYARVSSMLPFDSPFIGAVLIHLHMFTQAIGCLPLPVIISGEIFPLKYRSLSGAVSAACLSVNFLVSVKTFPLLLKTLKLHGTYLVYATIVTYCLIFACVVLPETKDKTLQEIEDEFKGRPVTRENTLSIEP